jgi:chaperonin cofactor prefoldin
MSSLSDDTLRKVSLCQKLSIAEHLKINLISLSQILVQIQQTAIQSQRALSVSRQQTAAKERERRILQLTIDEVNSLDSDVNVYKGVGKMFVPLMWPVSHC